MCGMKIFIKAKPNSKEEKVEQTGDSQFSVSVKEPPVGGRANAAIVRVLAEYFNVPKSAVDIISGYTMRQKFVEISGK